MKIYIFEELDKVSYNYHPGGGAVIIARDKRHARKLIEREENLTVSENDWKSVTKLTVGDTEEKIIIFQDAGCC